MHKEASSSDRHPAVVQGQEDLTGVKSVQIKRTLKKNSDEEYVIAQSVRTEMLYNTIDEAKDAYINIKDAMEEVDFEDTEKTEDAIEDTDTSAKEDTTASYAFGMSVLANDITGFSGVSNDETKQPINFDAPVSKEQLDAFTRDNGYATAVIPSPGANSRVGKDPVTSEAEYTSLIEPEFTVSDMEHELKLGVDRELEHVSDPAKALEIAIDHLAEDKDYYTKLNKVMPEYGPEEKPERTVEVSENPSDRELADKHDYVATYKSFTEDLLK